MHDFENGLLTVIQLYNYPLKAYDSHHDAKIIWQPSESGTITLIIAFTEDTLRLFCQVSQLSKARVETRKHEVESRQIQIIGHT